MTRHWVGEWREAAACRTADPELFYHPMDERGPTRRKRDARAKKVCAACPVMADCLAYSLDEREVYGVWGGLSESERAGVLGARARKAAPVLLGAPDALPTVCVSCGRPMVKPDAADIPVGSVRHAAKGVCRGCYSRAHRAGEALDDPAMQVDMVKVDLVMAGSMQATTTAERTEVIRRVRSAGGNDSDAGRRLGLTAAAVFKHRARWLGETITPRRRLAEAVA